MDPTHAEATPSTPLISTNPSADRSIAPRSDERSDFDIPGSSSRRRLLKWLPLLTCGLLILLCDVPAYMGEVPKLRMLEAALCREHYLVVDPGVVGDDGSVAEHLCKTHDIQGQLARMRGLLGMLEAVPGLALAIPYGVLADAKGRTLVMALSIVGIVLRDTWVFCALYFYNALPLSSIYANPAFLILGGGPIVLGPMVLATVAASIPEASRTQAFFWLAVCQLVTEIVAPPLGYLLMNRLGSHFAFLVGIPIETLTLVAVAFLRNTIQSSVDREGQQPLLSSDSNEDVEELRSNATGGLVQKVRQILQARRLRQGVRSRALEWNLLGGLLALVVAKMARPIFDIVLQYMSAKFKWPLDRTSFLLSLQAAAEIPLFALVLPLINRWLLQGKKQSPMAADLTVARGSLLFLCVGALSMGLASSAPLFIAAFTVYTMGSGFSSAVRSFLASLVSKEHLSLLFTAVTVFEGIASIGSSPLLGFSFSTGLDIGGMGLSLPFIVATCFYAMAGLALCTLARAKSN